MYGTILRVIKGDTRSLDTTYMFPSLTLAVFLVEESSGCLG